MEATIQRYMPSQFSPKECFKNKFCQIRHDEFIIFKKAESKIESLRYFLPNYNRDYIKQEYISRRALTDKYLHDSYTTWNRKQEYKNTSLNSVV